jgi:hypothetical protein
MTCKRVYPMTTDDNKPSDPQPPKKPRKPMKPWMAWVLAFMGVNPGYKPWEDQPPTPPAPDDKKPQP